MSASSNITVVGAGIVGTNLARSLARLGHAITFGARDSASPKVRAALDAVPGASAVALSDATADADIVILAVPFAAVTETVAALGDLGDTIVVDATNTVGADLPDGAASIVDVIHATRPDASVVKAFNTIGAEAYLDPVIDGRPAFLPVAGDGDAGRTIEQLAAAMGFDAVLVGGVDQAPLLEDFARLWIHLAFGVGLGRDFGFARVTR